MRIARAPTRGLGGLAPSPPPSVLAAILALAAMASLLLAAGPVSARSIFGPIVLQSTGSLEQFESAGEVAISADGDYLAFEGTLAGVRGVYRKDLQSGSIQLVAGGSIFSSEAQAVDAYAPSISADGRYVSFTTATALVKAAHPGSNVYVRDMAIDPDENGRCSEAQEAGGQCPYELASALDGETEGLTYAQTESERMIGANASGRISLSANGREVAFVIRGASDLTSRDPEQLSTPGLQVVVRNLKTRETVLVSAEREAASGQMTSRPVAGGAVTSVIEFGPFGPSEPRPGAALSADGSTVAWLGARIPEQVPTLSDEREVIEGHEGTADSRYDEPLWRRIEDGPGAPTRRIVGGGDPLAPGCPPDGTLAIAACRGPFPAIDSEIKEDQETNTGWLGIDRYDGTPQLSADGLTVALIGDPGGTPNVFVADMHEGLDRAQALRQLTSAVPVSERVNPGTEPQYVASSGDIYEVAISPSGEKIAFTTERQQFPLAPPTFTESPPSQVGVQELYEIDLAHESLVRVTHGPGEGASLEANPSSTTTNGAATPSFAEDGLTLAFADTASNLVAGDANHASDVFTVVENHVPETPGPVEIGAVAAGPGEEIRPQWRLSVVPEVSRDGLVTLAVGVPGGGRLSATATATVPAAAPASAATAGLAHPRRRPRISRLVRRIVAAAAMSAAGAGILTLRLPVGPRYAALLGTKAGLYMTVRVLFSGAGPPLSQSFALPVRASTHRRAPRAPARRIPGRRAVNSKRRSLSARAGAAG